MLKDHLEFVYRLYLNPFILSFPFKTAIFGCIDYHQTQPFFVRLLGLSRIDPGGAQWAEGDSAGEHSAGSAELFGFCQGCDWAMNFGGMILGSGRITLW